MCMLSYVHWYQINDVVDPAIGLCFIEPSTYKHVTIVAVHYTCMCPRMSSIMLNVFTLSAK